MGLVRFTEVYFEFKRADEDDDNDLAGEYVRLDDRQDDIALDANDVNYVEKVNEDTVVLDFYPDLDLSTTFVMGDIDQVVLKLNQARTRRF